MDDIKEQLFKLKELYQSGLISDEVYHERQRKLTDQYTSKPQDHYNTNLAKFEVSYSEEESRQTTTQNRDFNVYDPVIAAEMAKDRTNIAEPGVPGAPEVGVPTYQQNEKEDPCHCLAVLTKPVRKNFGVPDWGCGSWCAWIGLMLFGSIGYVVLGAIAYLVFFSTPINDVPFFSSDGETFAWIAVGQSAYGVLAVGQFAVGFITVGQITFGVINLSQVGIGLLFSVSMATAGWGGVIGMVAFGGYSIAGIITFGCMRSHHTMLGLQVLWPFFAKKKKLYSTCDEC
eukprot:TRINITY_DN1521_c0_g1_i1.p1 TRINITY_DN1521_c0_g1~~TRINITY_DN1521_c0_g1_i1.p1  ORF type:complete len:286 (+),score=41.69 TRINITY_DN1521_c0_g1_i1:13-870(+)